jgi:undecaprenyl-diphosphatase
VNEDAEDPFAAAQEAAQRAVAEVTAPAPERRRRAQVFQFSLLALIVAFGLLAASVRQTEYSPLDLAITRTVQSVDAPLFAWLMTLVSWFGFAPQIVAIPILAALLLYALGLHWESVASALAAAAVGALNTGVKLLIHRPRPAPDLVDVARMLDSYSFPSGHVMIYVGFFGFLFFLAYTLLRRSWVRTLLLAGLGALVGLVGLSRIYLGQHWASDVLGAYLLGGLALIGVIRAYRWGKPRFFVRQPAASGSD